MELTQIKCISEKFNRDQIQIFNSTESHEIFLKPIGLTLDPDRHKDFSKNAERMSPTIERQHFEALHFIKYTVWRHLSLNQDASNLVRLFIILRNRIVCANTPLVYECVKIRRINIDIDALISCGQFILIRAVECFDPWRGYKFSTYACTAIIKQFGKMLANQSVSIENFDAPNIAEKKPTSNESGISDIRAIIHQVDLTEQEQHILSCRFGTHIHQFRNDKKHTLKEIAEFIPLSIERIRQIQNNALEKIRRYIAENDLHLDVF